MKPLPIDSILPGALEQLRSSSALVLVAEPGAGKTTRLPPAILRAGLLPAEHPHLILLQPRRVAARAAAARIADENQWQLGREVGFQVRFERRISSATRLHVMTEGILTRRLLDDPILEGVGCVILDEFHERSLHTELAIALLKELKQTLRPELLIVVMSATLQAEAASAYLGEAPIVRSAGRAFAVDLSHQPVADRRETPREIARTVAALHGSDDAGDVLVFLPGVGEINRAIEAIESLAIAGELAVVPLHGSLGAADQLQALRPAPAGKRKIVVATNIAETSLTIDGVRTVIDSGWARVAMFDSRRGMDRLELQRISQASAAQRAGRAGRTAPGRCIRLWSAMEDRNLQPFETPEVRRVDMTATILALHAWGYADPRQFGWFEAPEERALAAGEQLLEMLGATSNASGEKITAIGRNLLMLPVHPRIGRLLVAAAEAGLIAEGAVIAALLSEKDILRRRHDIHPHDRRPATQGKSDLLYRLDLLNSSHHDEVDSSALWQVLKARDELEKIGRQAVPAGRAHARDEPADKALERLPLWAYPDRVCRRRSTDPSAGVMVGGAGVRLAPESVVRQHEFFLALDARQDQRNLAREAIVHIAHGIEADWLEEMFPQEIRRETSVAYDADRDRVVGGQNVLYRDLVLREHRDAPVDAETAGQVLASWAAPRIAELLRRDERAQRWLNRLALLRRCMPERGFPEDAEALARSALESAAAGKRSIAELLPQLLPALQAQLQFPLDRLMEAEAPEAIEVPSGSRIKLDYPAQADKQAITPPVLAVRLQEMFGLSRTPRIAGGRLPVQLHLLGPNFRPVQITDDLESFWKTAYFQVRKDLRVRYPRHAWPEDPLTAPPQAKGGRRR